LGGVKSSVHPRAYGSFARLLAKFVREEKLLTLEEAVRKLAALPAENVPFKKARSARQAPGEVLRRRRRVRSILQGSRTTLPTRSHTSMPRE
jgi:hypothetical protein